MKVYQTMQMKKLCFRLKWEAATRGALCKMVFLEISQNSQPQACNFIKKEALAQVFFCEFCGISKNSFFTEHLWATASVKFSSIPSTIYHLGKELDILEKSK